MCSGDRSSSANGAIALRHSAAASWSTSSSSVLSDWTMSGPSVTGCLSEPGVTVSNSRSPLAASRADSSGTGAGLVGELPDREEGDEQSDAEEDVDGAADPGGDGQLAGGVGVGVLLAHRDPRHDRSGDPQHAAAAEEAL